MGFSNRLRLPLCLLLFVSTTLASYCNETECRFTLEWKEKQQQQSMNDLDFMDIDDRENITKVTFEPNVLSFVPKGILEAFINLEIFNAPQQNISYIDVIAFGGEPMISNDHSLSIIDLSNNMIHYIPTLAFSKVEKLETLDLSHNNIKSINKDAFSNLKILKNLKMNNNQLTTINSTTFQYLESLEHIDLSNNQLQSVNLHAFSSNPLSIDLSMNNLESIAKMENFTNVQTLNLTGNQKLKLGLEDYQKMTTLINLYLMNTGVEVFDVKSVSEFPMLESLSIPAIDTNNVTMWKTKFPQLKKLSTRDNQWDCTNKIALLSCSNDRFEELATETTDSSGEEQSGEDFQPDTLIAPQETKKKETAGNKSSAILYVFYAFLTVGAILVLAFLTMKYMEKRGNGIIVTSQTSANNKGDAESGHQVTVIEQTNKLEDSAEDEVKVTPMNENELVGNSCAMTAVVTVEDNSKRDVENECQVVDDEKSQKLEDSSEDENLYQVPLEIESEAVGDNDETCNGPNETFNDTLTTMPVDNGCDDDSTPYDNGCDDD